MVKLVDCQQNCVLYEGKAVIAANQIQFENQIWRKEKDTLYIEKQADLTIQLCLKEGQKSVGTIESDYGTVEVELETDLLLFRLSEWEVSYRLGGQAFHFRLLMN